MKNYILTMSWDLWVIGCLKRLFDYAQAKTLVEQNPIASLPTRFITTQESRERALEPAEIRTFLVELYQSNIARRNKLALHLLLLTLTRKGELTRARWEHFHFDGSKCLDISVAKTINTTHFQMSFCMS